MQTGGGSTSIARRQAFRYSYGRGASPLVFPLSLDTDPLQNLRQDMAMDVDGEDTTQVVREVEDFGLVVDFSGVDEDDLAVSPLQ